MKSSIPSSPKEKPFPDSAGTPGRLADHLCTTTPTPGTPGMGTPLNPLLHAALVRAFQDVHTTTPGQTARLEPQVEWRGGRAWRRTTVSSGGEHYAVCCPFCGDLRFRLSIHHLYGTRDPESGETLIHLVHCFNDECLRDTARQREFFGMVFRDGARPLAHAALPAESSRRVAPRQSSLQLPDGFVRLDDPACPAAPLDYLTSRGFEPDELVARWEVGFSPRSDAPPPPFKQRIVIPIYDIVRPAPYDRPPKVVLVGWQARGLNDRKPKYVSATGTPTSQILYGLPQALSTQGPIVLVEGVTDVWRLGTHAVAVLGKALLSDQLRLLSMFPGRPVVVFVDQDAAREARAIQEKIRRYRRNLEDRAPVVVARPPAGRKDVGECSREEAWQAVAKALGWSFEKLLRQLKQRRI